VSQAAAGPQRRERRRSERIPVPSRGAAISVVGARVVSISAHGMWIESLVPMERERTITLRVVVAGEKIDVEARVACCSLLASSRRRVYGVGLEFAALPETSQERLRETLTRMKAVRPQL
jgi:PilZ domain-containing protein